MSDVVPFQFDEYEIRVIRDEHGEPWFVAKDVCEALEIGNTSDALRRLDDDEVDSIEVTDSLGRKQMTGIVNEPGLYSLIMSSRKSEAHKFKRWITHDVLPSLRRTGIYALSAGAAHCYHLPFSPSVVSNTFRSFAAIARAAGFKGHQVALYANTATRKLTGVDCLALMNATHLFAEIDVLHFTAAQLGERIGLTGEEFCDLLVDRGLAEGADGIIGPTERGEPYAVILGAGGRYGDRAPVQEVMWLESVLDILKD